MAQTIRISRDFLVQAMRSAPVRAGLEAKAEEVKARAEQLAAADGVAMTVTLDSKTRPRGRPAVNVVSDNVDQEFGTAKVARRRILGRAAEGS